MSYRRLDIDSLQLDDEEIDIAAQKLPHHLNPSDLLNFKNLIHARAQQVNSFVNKGDFVSGLRCCLDGDQPYSFNSTSPADQNLILLKDECTKLVMDIIIATKQSEINTILNQLEPSQLNLLFKYIYRAMEFPNLFNCATILTWHEKLSDKAGVGGILRVITDRKLI